MHAKLVVVGGKAQAEQFDLTLPTIVGRSRTSDLKLGHPLVSRQHCELYEAEGMLMVRDLGSLNGTFVGESRINEETPLEPGGLLTIGSVTFRAEYSGAAAPAQAARVAAVPAAEPEGRGAAEVGQTLEASGLADLERRAEDIEPPIEEPVAEEAVVEELDEGDLNLEWLEDEFEEAPATTDEAPQASSAAPPEPAQAEVVEELELSLEIDEIEEVQQPVAAQPAAAEDLDDLQLVDESGGDLPSPGDETATFAPPAGEEQPRKVEDDDLDDFFKSLE